MQGSCVTVISKVMRIGPSLRWASRLSEAEIYIDDTPGVTVADIRAKCRRLKKRRVLA